MLSNAYFLAKFRVDTAENEPAKNLQNFANFPNFANPSRGRLRGLLRRDLIRGRLRGLRLRGEVGQEALVVRGGVGLELRDDALRMGIIVSKKREQCKMA